MLAHRGLRRCPHRWPALPRWPALRRRRSGRACTPTKPTIEDVMRPSKDLDINDPMAVFGFVLDSLPERVRVYPTENYYYFRFHPWRVPYVGNIRLDAADRDDGKVNFGYYPDYAPWRAETPVTFRLLGRSRRGSPGEARAPRLPPVISDKERGVRAQRPVCRQASRHGARAG